MGDATVNGDMPQSQVLSHISSYPAVSDGISYFKGNPYGAKSIEVTNAGYAKFIKPALPYFEAPASYAKPYAAKADEIGDKLLTKVDERVPIVKSETKDIQKSISDLIYWPFTKATETKDWAFDTYSSEYKKCGGDGYVAGGKAAVTTPLVLGSEVLQWLSSFLQAKKDEAKQVVAEKTNN
ncbi:uncharacterized protein HMPREF1541_03383 [Cyphellophora europaea CBS 101466]|uniref:Pathogenesis associated protein Cap20 n=1 Tax=Cyphellophora europaea (strain CBS 101466) TaxID=1220924 RepID=W2RYE1_CYPE1|nr:uncharacterized protein HMPREF1541_03383 [Cyphellophora europaea CBS 101466]ETN41447.1 hypothetical protein HMPREF1541_03383 [Cyphellophora europaea CBS 101466]